MITEQIRPPSHEVLTEEQAKLCEKRAQKVLMGESGEVEIIEISPLDDFCYPSPKRDGVERFASQQGYSVYDPARTESSVWYRDYKICEERFYSQAYPTVTLVRQSWVAAEDIIQQSRGRPRIVAKAGETYTTKYLLQRNPPEIS